jgi:hypothetical protein
VIESTRNGASSVTIWRTVVPPVPLDHQCQRRQRLAYPEFGVFGVAKDTNETIEPLHRARVDCRGTPLTGIETPALSGPK